MSSRTASTITQRNPVLKNKTKQEAIATRKGDAVSITCVSSDLTSKFDQQENKVEVLAALGAAKGCEKLDVFSKALPGACGRPWIPWEDSEREQEESIGEGIEDTTGLTFSRKQRRIGNPMYRWGH